MAKVTGNLTRRGRALLHEMAKDKRVIFPQRHRRHTMEIEYHLNSFPIRRLRPNMVAKLARGGYIALGRRGYFSLTAKGMLEASITEENKK